MDPSGLIPLATEFFRRALDRAREAKDFDAVKEISGAHEGFLALREENARLKDQLRELERAVEEHVPASSLTPHQGWYWRRVEDRWDGPFCTLHFDRDRMLVRARVTTEGTACADARCRRPVTGAVKNPEGRRVEVEPEWVTPALPDRTSDLDYNPLSRRKSI